MWELPRAAVRRQAAGGALGRLACDDRITGDPPLLSWDGRSVPLLCATHEAVGGSRENYAILGVPEKSNSDLLGVLPSLAVVRSERRRSSEMTANKPVQVGMTGSGTCVAAN